MTENKEEELLIDLQKLSEESLINTDGKDYYKELEAETKEKKSFMHRLKYTFSLTQSRRKKEALLPIMDKLENNEPLSGTERSQVVNQIQHKMSPDDIHELDRQRKRFMYHSTLCVTTSLVSCFVFSVLSKRYLSLKPIFKLPINLAIFFGSLSFTMAPAYQEMADIYGDLMEKNKEYLTRDIICGHFEWDNAVRANEEFAKQLAEMKRYQKGLNKVDKAQF